MEHILQPQQANLGLIGCIAVAAIFYFLKDSFNKKKDDKPKEE